MFEKVKSAAKRVRTNVEKARASSRGMDVESYRAERKELEERKRKDENDFRKWKIDEDYRQKKKAYRQRKRSGGMGGGFLGSIADLGANVNKNVSGGGGLESFNRAVRSPSSSLSPTKRKRRKKKGKVIEIRLK